MNLKGSWTFACAYLSNVFFHPANAGADPGPPSPPCAEGPGRGEPPLLGGVLRVPGGVNPPLLGGVLQTFFLLYTFIIIFSFEG